MPQGEPATTSAGPARAAGEDKDMCTASEEEGQQYCLRWNNYQSNMTSVFHQLLQNQAFVDVTLACNDLSLKAHKVVLSACSAYFQRLLLENPCSHPTIIMPSDMCFADLQFIIEFVYRGEIDVSQTELQSLLKTAEQLKIKGLCELPDSPARGAAGSSEPTPPEQGHGKTVAPRRPPTKLRRGATGGGGRLGSGPCSAAKRPRSALDLDCVNIKTEPGQHDTKADPYDSDEVDDKSSLSQLVRDYSSRNDRPGDQEDKSSLIQLVRDYSSRNDRSEDQDDKSSLSQLVRDYSSRNDRSEDQEDRSSVGYVAGDGTDIPLVLLESRHGAPHAQDMTNTSILSTQYSFQSFFHGAGMCDEYAPEPPGPSATPVTEPNSILDQRDLSDTMVLDGDVKIKFETLRAMDQCDVSDMDGHVSQHSQHSHQSGHSVTSQNSGGGGEFGGGNGHDLGPISSMLVTPELLGLLPSSSHSEEETYYDMMSDGSNDEHSLSKSGQDSQNGTMGHMLGMGMDGLSRSGSEQGHRGQGGPKTWSQDDMELALDALRNHNMSLTKASATYGIPSTTLWQRAHRLGIDTPKKEGPSKNWSEDSLNNALEALRTGTISANKASKAYGIPSSTLYKIARREGIRLAAPFNAAPTTWSPDDLERALEAIRSGQTSVQRASTEFGIPTGTLYGRCKREGIELSRSNPTPWSEDAMGEALEAVRVGQMSINQAAIHYNLPYSSLYGRFKRGKYEMEPGGTASGGGGSGSHADSSPETMAVNYQTHHNSNSHVYPPDHIS